jgi:hypothetical protein
MLVLEKCNLTSKVANVINGVSPSSGYLSDAIVKKYGCYITIYGENTMMELNSKIEKALTDIDFIKRYEQLSISFNDKKTPLKERLRYFDGEIIMDSIAQLGYIVNFESKEKYIKIKEEQIGDYKFSIHIILDNGMVDLVWIVKEKQNILLGLPVGEYSRLMIDPSFRIGKPIFGAYEDLDEIFEISFKIFEDFKQVLLNNKV